MIIGDGSPKWICPNCGEIVNWNVEPELHVRRRAQLIHARTWCRPVARPVVRYL